MTDEMFANGKVSSVFIKLAIPSILVLLLMISTFVIDGILIGQFIGIEGLAAFNLVYPVFSVLIAIAVVIATGGSAIVGKYLGQNKIEEANQVFNLALILAVIFSITLSEIKFGILGTLDFKEIFAKKGIDYPNEYKLLEICNPQVAKKALDSDPNIGLLLSCTIAIYEKDGENYVSLAKPTTLLSVVSNTELESMGKEIEEKLIEVINISK